MDRAAPCELRSRVPVDEFYERYWSDKGTGKLSDFDRKWPVLAPLIPREPGLSILDYGCGNGEILTEIQRLNPRARCMGADVSETALGVARRRLPEVPFYGLRDGGRTPLDSGSVDFIFCSEVIEHVYDTEATFQELARLLKPGGRILLTTPHHGLVKNILLVLFAFDRHFDPGGPHIRFFTRRSLFASLRRAGMWPERHGYIGRFYPVSMAIYVLARRA
jgi:2-polyprenyl-3-methyl-5-hydroxy-6-metoxy-1,4-benzoquinol methylase